MILNECTLKWFKIDEHAKIPTKTDTAAGYDIYTIEDNITIPAHTTYMFRTGLAVAPSEGYWLMAFDRGSTGSKGLHVHCGVVDNDYRGEIFICIKNDNKYPVVITRNEEPGMHHTGEGDQPFYSTYLVYSPDKAIAQLIPVAQPKTNSLEVSAEEWEELKNTERGEGKLGSSGK